MRTLLALSLAGALLLSGCGSATDDSPTADASGSSSPSGSPSAESAPPSPDGKDPAATLQRARDLWQSNGPSNYTWTVERICYCPPQRVHATVSDGEAEAVKGASGPGLKQIAVMEDLFDLIEKEIRQADKVTASYDPETGAVQKFESDRLRGAADDEIGYVVKQLKPAS